MGVGEGSADSSSRGHAPDARLREWVLLDGHRGVVAGITAAIVLAILTPVSVLVPLTDSQPVFYVFGGLISGNLTIITVVVSINQLLLSQELKTPDELRAQIEGVVDYREDVEDTFEGVAPAEPLGFLRLLVEKVRQTAQQLGGLTFTETPEGISDDIERIVSRVTDHADLVDDLLQKSDASTFTVLSTTLTTNYARDINQLRQLRVRYGDQLPAHVDESIDDLVDRLRDVDIARQYFKTIYLQQELASLSRYLFYAGFPSITAVVVAVLLFTANDGAAVPSQYAPLIVSCGITAGLVPLIVLFTFILRTATVTRRTAATVPFTVPAQER